MQYDLFNRLIITMYLKSDFPPSIQTNHFLHKIFISTSYISVDAPI